MELGGYVATLGITSKCKLHILNVTAVTGQTSQPIISDVASQPVIVSFGENGTFNIIQLFPSSHFSPFIYYFFVLL